MFFDSIVTREHTCSHATCLKVTNFMATACSSAIVSNRSGHKVFMKMSFNPEEYLRDKFQRINLKINKHEVKLSQEAKSYEENNECVVVYQGKGLGSLRATLDDIERGIKYSKFSINVPQDVAFRMASAKIMPSKRMNPFIKVSLRKSPNILLFELRSTTVLKDTEEGLLVEEDNKRYDYLTEGMGRRRTMFSAETQTAKVLTKTRGVNTQSIFKDHVGSYVSNFEMFDTYKDLEKTTQSFDVGGGVQTMEVTTYKVGGVDQFIDINKLPQFQLALMLTMRILAGNNYEQSQRRFRNMIMPDPLAMEVHYLYRVDLLWKFCITLPSDYSVSVSDMTWCPNNGDILAVSYGTFTTTCGVIPLKGCACIWNIKNPVNPERIYHFNAPVQSVEFSTFAPQLLAIGLYDGAVYVYDISEMNHPQIAMSERGNSTIFEPISAIKWTPHSPSETKLNNNEPFLVLTRDGCVIRYTIINSAKLLEFTLMKLNRVEGCVEGVQLDNKPLLLEANPHPQGLDICLDPMHLDVYYVLTDEGCQHKCSTNYPQQELAVLQLHEAGISHMEFSPWSPKLYLTCGNDWSIRIWLLGIHKPIITLKYHMSPVCTAHWSTVHSTIIVSLHRDAIDIWDLRKSILKPASSTRIDANLFYTTMKLSLCGRSVAVGTNHGPVEVLAFEDMPFPPHYQYEHLVKTIYLILANEAELLRIVKSFGYFGYPKE